MALNYFATTLQADLDLLHKEGTHTHTHTHKHSHTQASTQTRAEEGWAPLSADGRMAVLFRAGRYAEFLCQRTRALKAYPRA